MKIVEMRPEELQKAIDEGRAQRIHLYNCENILMPRGSMKKESIGLYILERLKGNYEYWTDSKYGDNPPKEEVVEILHRNLMNEVNNAWEEFIGEIKNGKS